MNFGIVKIVSPERDGWHFWRSIDARGNLSLALNSKIKQTATESYLKMPMHRRLAKKDKLTEHRIQLGHTHRRRSIMT